MSAVNPNGSQKYWIDGKPVETLVANNKPVYDSQRYWIDGKPSKSLIPRKRPRMSSSS